MEKYYCSACGKENTLDLARFCAYCGAELVARGLSSEEETGALCGAVYRIYAGYINWSSDYIASRPAGKVFSALFTGDSDYKSRPEHEEFIAVCEKAVGELYAHFSTGGFERGKILKLLDYVLFDCHEHCGNEAEWMIFAVEKFFLPFMDHLSKEEAGDFYERYRAFRKRKRGLPVQDEMLKKLKKKSK